MEITQMIKMPSVKPAWIWPQDPQREDENHFYRLFYNLHTDMHIYTWWINTWWNVNVWKHKGGVCLHVQIDELSDHLAGAKKTMGWYSGGRDHSLAMTAQLCKALELYLTPKSQARILKMGLGYHCVSLPSVAMLKSPFSVSHYYFFKLAYK